MPELLLLSEYRTFGVPVWQFAASREEALYVYAPRQLGDRNDVEGAINESEMRAWVRTYSEPWGLMDLARFGQVDYGLYLPWTEKDFNALCMAAAGRGGSIEVIVPSKLCEHHGNALTPIWATVRPLRYLRQADLCRALEVPWVYLLGIYNYHPCLSVFIAESESMVAEVFELTKGVQDCKVVPLREALSAEQRDWSEIYGQRDV